ncbi:MAG: hypothetical protein RQ760_19035 [Sedimentisphaerales bacterium]|nr:hypothetical protein [Sedimentisphaerales bacterium]
MGKRKVKHVFFITTFMIVLLSVGVVQVSVELSEGEQPQLAELFGQLPTTDNLRMFENDLEKNCRLAKKLRPSVQYIRFLVLRDTGDKALIGRSGWFFYKPAVQYLIEPLPADSQYSREDVLSAVISFRDQLARRGIRLLVVPAPNKASLYPEMLTSRAEDLEQLVNPKTIYIISKLRESGVEIVDLFRVFAEAREGLTQGDSTRYYLSQDSHWSPEGMRLAAQAVAGRILDLVWAGKGKVKYSLNPATVRRHGDVLKMMQASQIENMFEPESLNCDQVVNATTGRRYEDDPNSEVLVMGDSFLRIYSGDEPGSGGFIEHLAVELGFPLTSIVNDGGASTLVRQELSRKPALLRNKKLVIWEFVERDIRFGMEGWQQVLLPPIP